VIARPEGQTRGFAPTGELLGNDSAKNRLSRFAMLTKLEAESLVLTCLKSRYGCEAIAVGELSGEREREFGWVFGVTAAGAAAGSSANARVPTLVIVNKYSEQVVASTIEYNVEEFVRLYEMLLAKNQSRHDNWCLTLPLPWSRWGRRTVAERAREGGFYEIRAKEDGHE